MEYQLTRWSQCNTIFLHMANHCQVFTGFDRQQTFGHCSPVCLFIYLES